MAPLLTWSLATLTKKIFPARLICELGVSYLQVDLVETIKPTDRGEKRVTRRDMARHCSQYRLRIPMIRYK